MTQLCGHDSCVGCGACANICPRSCIRMEPDREGFCYPQVDAARCVECGLCQTACPVLGFSTETEEYGTYAVHNRDADVVHTSSSGGVFTALAERTIRLGGVVYGAAFRDDWSVAHLRIEQVQKLSALRGSKYVQSDLGMAYAKAQQDLKSGCPVLFSGTPCQVAGLRQYLGRDYDNLICVDIICHSVPSPMAWRSYLLSLGKATAVNFRDKRDSWQGYYLSVGLADGGEVLVRGKENRYMRAFIQGLSTRPSCYGCKFKGINRGSDITLGDFWGVEEVCPTAFHKSGTSLVLIQTERGRQAFDAVSGMLTVTPADRTAALQGNPAYSVQAKPHQHRDTFFRQLGNVPFGQLIDQLLAPTGEELRRQKWDRSIAARVIRKLKRMIKN